jgi:hypothetical protein
MEGAGDDLLGAGAEIKNPIGDGLKRRLLVQNTVSKILFNKFSKSTFLIEEIFDTTSSGE